VVDVQAQIAEISDAESITSLINAAFRVEKFFVDGDRIDLEQVRSLFQRGEFLVFRGDRGLAGCVYLETGGERGYLGLLSIDPVLQRSGLGSRLVTAAEDRCRTKNCRFMDLQIVNIREELPRFYARLGYVAGGTGPFPAEVPTRMPCHFVKMWKALG
jgi:GNAT superfamily N-acetyltransferase